MERLSLNKPLSCCENCHAHCCLEVQPFGGLISGPFLTEIDITRISKNIGIARSEFVQEIYHPRTLKMAKFIKTPGGVACMFYDWQTHFCAIHNSRPLDCRLFPFDFISKGDNRYQWIVYDICAVDEREIKRLLQSAKEEILPFMMQDLRDYSMLPMGLTEQGRYQVLEEFEV